MLNFFIGLAVLPVGFGLWWLATEVKDRFRYWYTKPVNLTGRTLVYRRSLIVGMTLELLDASHVRAVRLPFNRFFIIRSTPVDSRGVRREYDFISKGWVLVGGGFDEARAVIGKALDELGYAVESDG